MIAQTSSLRQTGESAGAEREKAIALILSWRDAEGVEVDSNGNLGIPGERVAQEFAIQPQTNTILCVIATAEVGNLSWFVTAKEYRDIVPQCRTAVQAPRRFGYNRGAPQVISLQPPYYSLIVLGGEAAVP